MKIKYTITNVCNKKIVEQLLLERDWRVHKQNVENKGNIYLPGEEWMDLYNYKGNTSFLYMFINNKAILNILFEKCPHLNLNH